MFETITIWKVFLIALAFYGGLRLITDRSDCEKSAAIMWALEREPNGLRGTELHSITGISISTIYVYLARLERQALVRRVIDPLTRVHRFYFESEAARKLWQQHESRSREDA